MRGVFKMTLETKVTDLESVCENISAIARDTIRRPDDRLKAIHAYLYEMGMRESDFK
jgi:hypothetical protein